MVSQGWLTATGWRGRGPLGGDESRQRPNNPLLDSENCNLDLEWPLELVLARSLLGGSCLFGEVKGAGSTIPRSSGVNNTKLTPQQTPLLRRRNTHRSPTFLPTIKGSDERMQWNENPCWFVSPTLWKPTWRFEKRSLLVRLIGAVPCPLRGQYYGDNTKPMRLMTMRNSGRPFWVDGLSMNIQGNGKRAKDHGKDRDGLLFFRPCLAGLKMAETNCGNRVEI
ncbi:hypothetical protein VTK26DRAFT_8663 [Humicola hyalothermophila]